MDVVRVSLQLGLICAWLASCQLGNRDRNKHHEEARGQVFVVSLALRGLPQCGQQGGVNLRENEDLNQGKQLHRGSERSCLTRKITKVDLPCCCSQKHRQALQPRMIRAESQRDSGSPEKREQVILMLLCWSSAVTLMEEVRNGILSSSWEDRASWMSSRKQRITPAI